MSTITTTRTWQAPGDSGSGGQAKAYGEPSDMQRGPTLVNTTVDMGLFFSISSLQMRSHTYSRDLNKTPQYSNFGTLVLAAQDDQTYGECQTHLLFGPWPV